MEDHCYGCQVGEMCVCVFLPTSLICFLSVALSFNSVSVFGFVPHSHATGAKTALAWTKQSTAVFPRFVATFEVFLR